MAIARNGTGTNQLDAMIQESSKQIMQALRFARGEASYKENWLRAAECEEQVAYRLELDGCDLDTAIHRFSAASCYAKAEQYAEAITLARSALSFSLRDAHRSEIVSYVKKWLAIGKKKLRNKGRKKPVAAS
jgi:hypothetical protein